MIFINSYTSFPVVVVQNSVEYPPLALTTNSTNITTASYGNGTYIASASRILNGSYDAFRAFNKSLAILDLWSPGGQLYSTTTGLTLSGVLFPAVISGVNYSGDWLKLQLPTAITVTSYNITSFVNTGSDWWKSPREFVLAGSNNNTTWTFLDQRTNINWTAFGQTSEMFNIASPASFNYYVIVVQAMGVGVGSDGVMIIGEMRLFGY
jgi:hypothetical protein